MSWLVETNSRCVARSMRCRFRIMHPYSMHEKEDDVIVTYVILQIRIDLVPTTRQNHGPI